MNLVRTEHIHTVANYSFIWMGKTDLHNRGSPLWKYPEVSGFPPEGGQEFNYQVSVPAGRRILKPEFHEKKGHLRRGKQSGGP